MGVGQMQRQLLEYANSLFLEGFLDASFFELHQLEDESDPDFVGEVVSLFFEDSERLLNDITAALDRQSIDFRSVGRLVHELKGSSSSLGAQRMKNVCIAFRSFCEEPNIEGCIRCLQQVKQEYCLVKSKLEILLRLRQQIVAAGGAIPMIEVTGF